MVQSIPFKAGKLRLRRKGDVPRPLSDAGGTPALPARQNSSRSPASGHGSSWKVEGWQGSLGLQAHHKASFKDVFSEK